MKAENKQIYLDRMRASMKEKLFWLNIIPHVGGIIDFGCADGELLAQIEELNLKDLFMMVGIDQNSAFLEIAKSKVNYATFLKNVNELSNAKIKRLNDSINGDLVFNFSSVLHELYSFCSKAEIDKILLAATTSKYITIRDMLKPSIYLKNNLTSLQHMNSAYFDSNVIKAQLDDLELRYHKEYTQFFNNKKMTLDNYIQFLMKLMYINNWGSEIKEDYFLVDWDYIDTFFKEHGFELMYKNDYSNEYVANRLDLPDLITHRQLIYRKVEK